MFVYLIHKELEDLESHDEAWEIHASLITAKAAVEKLIDEPVKWERNIMPVGDTTPQMTYTPTPNAKKQFSYDGKPMGRDSYTWYISKERVL